MGSNEGDVIGHVQEIGAKVAHWAELVPSFFALDPKGGSIYKKGIHIINSPAFQMHHNRLSERDEVWQIAFGGNLHGHLELALQ